ncbi:amidohydrolase family protein, partial [candidate division KSB1 bacterium]
MFSKINKTLFRISIMSILLLLFSVQVFAQGDMFISNAKMIITGTGEKIENASILIRNGKIEAIGTDIQAPSGVRVVDATGLYIMPGIIDQHVHIAMQGTNEATSQNSSGTDVSDVVVHDDFKIYRALAGGVTTVHQLHGSANVIGGKDEVIKLKWGRPVEELKIDGQMEGLKFALGENVLRSHAPNRSTNNRSRMDVEFHLRNYFVEALEYKRAWDEYELKKKGKIKPANDYEKKHGPVPPKRDLKKETVLGVIEGRIRSHIHGYSNSELAMFGRIATEFGFKPTSYEHVLEGYQVADEIAATNTVASVFADNWNYKVEAELAIPFNAALLTERGVKVSINSDDVGADLIRRLNLDAAKTIRYGNMPEDEAIRTITLNAAYGLRLQDRIGSLEIGKDGDIAIYDADPLSIYSKCVKTIIEGEIFFDRDNAITTEKWIKGQPKKKTTNEESR